MNINSIIFTVPESSLKKRKVPLYLGVSEEDIEKIKAFWDSKKDLVVENTHFRKPEGLCRSVVIIPGKGCFVLCKTKGIDWKREGGFSSVTIAFNVDTREKVVFRSSKSVSQNEIIAHQEYPKDSYFVNGDIVQYYKDVPKTGMIMPYFPHDLRQLINEMEIRPRPKEVLLKILIGLTEAHIAGRNFVNFDFSPYNIVLKEDLTPRICDFGSVFRAGAHVEEFCGTKGFYSPETMNCLFNARRIIAHSSAEIWSLGVIMSLMVQKLNFFEWLSRNTPFTEVELNTELMKNFNPHNMMDILILGCLRYHPEERIAGEELLQVLQGFLKSTKTLPCFFSVSKVDRDKIKAIWLSKKDEITQPTHVRKREGIISRSFVVIPGKGCFVLCKTKGVKLIGIGGFGRATFAFNVETREPAVFRSSKAVHVFPNEIAAHRLYPNDSYFVKGDLVNYRGPWKKRMVQGRAEKDIEKIGVVMPFIPNGELNDFIHQNPHRKLEQFSILIDLIKAHLEGKKVNLVNLDLSSYNVILDKDNNPRIVDFGGVFEKGTPLKIPSGARGFNAPEVLNGYYFKRDVTAEPSAEIWSLGIILAQILRANEFIVSVSKVDKKNVPLPFSEEELYISLVKHFPDYQNTLSLDYLVHRCLCYNPEERITGEELLSRLHKSFHGK